MSSEMVFYTNSTGGGQEVNLVLTETQDVLVGGLTAAGASASGVLAIANGTQGAALANAIQIVSEDLSAGNTIPSIRTEGSGILDADSMAIKVNGSVVRLKTTTPSFADVVVTSAAATNAITATVYRNALENANIGDAGLSAGFTVDNTNKRVTYNSGMPTRVYRVTGSIGMTSSKSNEIAYFRLAKNGTTDADTTQERKIGTGSDVGALAIQGMFSLAPTDYIELHTTLGASTSDTVTVEMLNLSIVPV
jgi:hypothetical protein